MSDIILDNAENVIAAFGGIRPMAKKLGVAVTTVQGWKERGTIPIARLDEIKEAARAEGIDLMAAAQADTAEEPASSPPKTPTAETPSAETAPTADKPLSTRPAGSVPPAGAKAPEPSRPNQSTPGKPSDRDASTGASAASSSSASSSSAGAKSAGAESVRADRVRPVPEAGVKAAEAAADSHDIIEEEIVEYEDRGWRARTAMFGIGFGFAAVLGFAGAWYLGAFDQTASLSAKDKAAWEARFAAASDARTKVETQLTKVERQLAETAKALAAANATLAEMRKSGEAPAKQLDGLRGQVAELTKRIDALPKTAGDTGAIAGLADRMREIEKKLAGLSAGGGKAAETLTKENAQLREGLAAADKRLTALESRIGQLSPGGGYGALVIAIGQLRDTAFSGRAFKAELDRVRVLAKDYPEVIKLTTPLAAVAPEGVASRASLVEGFSRASTAMMRATAQEVEGDWIDRALGRMRSMVTIRRTGPNVEGTTPAALVTRAENALAAGRLGDALALVGQLPAPARAAGKSWIDRATTRLQAETALDRLQATVLKLVTGAGGDTGGGTGGDSGAKP